MTLSVKQLEPFDKTGWLVKVPHRFFLRLSSSTASGMIGRRLCSLVEAALFRPQGTLHRLLYNEVLKGGGFVLGRPALLL